MNERTETRRIAVLVGSLRAQSFNARLADTLGKRVPAHVEWQRLALHDLPLYNQDLDADMPEPVQRLKREIAAADGVVFVTPEYNRSIPGVLKNAIDWASRPYGQNAFAHKPSAVIGVSLGAIGTAIAQQHLRTVLAYLDVPTLGQPEAFIQHKADLFGDDGKVTNEAVDKLLQRWLDGFLRWVETVRSARSSSPG